MSTNSRTPGRWNQNRLWGFLLLPLVLVIPVADIAAGVLVSPTVVFLSSQSRTGRMTLQNPTDQPREVTIRFSFGLPVSDSLGNVHVSLQDSNVTDPQSAMGWVRAFPRKLVLAPNATQIVRFVATPPKDIPDGEYWSRIVVRSRESGVEIPTSSDEGSITTQLNMVMQTAVMLKYRKGDLVSQVEVTDMSTEATEEMIEVMVDMKSNGKVSYVGMLNARLLDSNNDEVSTVATQVAVYRSLRRKLLLPITGNRFTGPFQVELLVTTKGRNDIAAEDMLPGNEVQLTQTVD